MSDLAPRAQARPRYWNKWVTDEGAWRSSPPFNASPPPGEDLQALRAGLGEQAFTVPRLWPYYATPVDGEVTREAEAEHVALSLYGLHQQGHSTPMHRPGVKTGRALRALEDRFGEEAVERRVAAAVSATSVPAFAHRLRGLVTQLRAIGQPLDYNQLQGEIFGWHFAESRSRVLRQWGLAFRARELREDADHSA